MEICERAYRILLEDVDFPAEDIITVAMFLRLGPGLVLIDDTLLILLRQ